MNILVKLAGCFSLVTCGIITGISQNPRGIEDKVVDGFNISVYLPPGYDTLKSCKVLYFNDGQTVFGKKGLDVDGMADDLIQRNLIEPIIVVGIHSDHNRTSNYVPYEDPFVRMDFGEYQPGAGRYSKRIITRIIPFIEKIYKTKPDRGIAGYSFGGLHATWIALNYPKVFSFSGSLSPSYWVSNFKVFNEGAKAQECQTYYFDVGTGEWNYYVPMLLHSNLPMLRSIFYYEDFGGRHVLEDWRGRRIRNALLLFAGKTDLTAYSWEVKQEIIKSSHDGKFYPRINPIITYSNGLTCSISYAASFTVLNPEDGAVNRDGSFGFTNPKDLKIRIGYNGEEKTILISYTEVEGIKARLK